VAAQLAASQEGLSSMSESVSNSIIQRQRFDDSESERIWKETVVA
jgi:hypothetical protein